MKASTSCGRAGRLEWREVRLVDLATNSVSRRKPMTVADRVPPVRHLDHLEWAGKLLVTAGRILAEPMARLLVMRRSGGKLES